MNRARFFAAAVVAIVAFSACASGEPPTAVPSSPPTAVPSSPPTVTPSPPPTVSPSPPPTATPSPPPTATEPALPEIDLGRLYQVLELDEIEPIYEPVFETKGRTRLGDEQLVMGVALNGEAKAYPVSLMQVREMVNDEVGGTPVLVTW